MAIDRDETLRKADKLLRLGNLAAALTEYARVAEAFPADLTTVNKLGELYQRKGNTDAAVTQFMTVADLWMQQGQFAKAATHYKKILKLAPQTEPALLQLVKASIRQGLLDEAKVHLRTARDARLARHDQAGADDLTLELADLDTNDFDARLAGLRVRLGRERTPGLASEVRATLAVLERQGRHDEVETLLAQLIRLDPDDMDARERVARAAISRGDVAAARAALPRDPASSDRYEVLAMAMELEIGAGALEAGQVFMQRLLSLHRVRAIPAIATLAERLFVAEAPDVSYLCFERLIDEHTAAKQFAAAAGRLKRFLQLAPHHVPALMRLVEVCVDGDLDADVTIAQEQLAEAYLSTGEAGMARVIAEDLLLRDPHSALQRDRLHRVLVALGEDDPDAIIADHLLLVEDGIEEPVAPQTPPVPVLGAPVATATTAESEGTLPAVDEAAPDAVGFEAPGLDVATPDAARGDGASDAIGAAEELSLDGSGAEPVLAAGMAPPLGGSIDTTLDEVAIGADAIDVSGGEPFGGLGFGMAPPLGGLGEDLELDPDPQLSASLTTEIDPVLGDVMLDVEAGDGPAFTPGVEASALVSEPAALESPDGIAAQAEPDLGVAETAVAASDPAALAPGSFDTPAPVWTPPEDIFLEPADFPAGLGSSDALFADLPDAPSHLDESVATAGPGAASDSEADGDAILIDEIDLTGALDALSRTGVSIGEALDAATTRPGANRNGGPHGAGAQNGAGPHGPAGIAGLSAHLNGMNGQAGDDDLDSVFDGLRAQVAGDMIDLPPPEQSERLLSMAETYQAAGMFEEARAALEQVATDSRFRFRAGAALGQLFWHQGQADKALRWLELASEASAPTPDAGRAVMYELAERLEQTGETTRALAVFLDLLAEAQEYRDVRARVDRLSKVQAER